MTYPTHWNTRAPRLKTIAKWINEHTTLIAEVVPSYYDTSSKIAGTRFRRPGKRRAGNRLIVATSPKDLTFLQGRSRAVLHHNTAETYRTNAEVVAWLHNYLECHGNVIKEGLVVYHRPSSGVDRS